MSSVMHIRGIGMSEPITQYEVKHARCDDDHVEVTSGRDHIVIV
jgi:hypothetical protein